ncbi:hypothetical protein ABW286_03675 [Erwinia papayae]|uniref:Uncharacterized protein n=1 Tax=Erwinia papayae TaxID=206499 RepID=A0ABV3MXJ6_9GAMM
MIGECFWWCGKVIQNRDVFPAEVEKKYVVVDQQSVTANVCEVCNSNEEMVVKNHRLRMQNSMLLVNIRTLEKKVVVLNNKIHELNEKKVNSKNTAPDFSQIEKVNLNYSANSSKENLKKSGFEINNKNPALEKTGL